MREEGRLAGRANHQRHSRHHGYPDAENSAGVSAALWIADLDSAELAAREKAMRELVQRGEAVEGALRLVLEDRPSLEVRQRIKLLLEGLQGAHRLRMLRAVEVREHLGTAQARHLLEALAQGATDAQHRAIWESSVFSP